MSVQANSKGEALCSNGKQPLAVDEDLHPRPFTPSHWTYRYTVLILIFVVKVTLNFVFDTPAGLENTILRTLKIDVTRYDLLYSIYSWPLVVLHVFAGVLNDRVLGLRLGTVVFSTVAVVGQVMFTLGGFYGSYTTMLVSRFISGIGIDITFAVTDALGAVWFKGGELTFMIAMFGFGCRLGGALTLYLNQIFYTQFGFIANKHIRLGATFSVGLCLTLLCFLCTLVLFFVDRRGEKCLKASNKRAVHESVRCKDVTKFGLNFWLVVGSVLIFYGCYFPFVATAQVFFISKFGLSTGLVSIAETLVYVASMMCLFTGVLINWTGFNVLWGLLGLLIAISVHVLFFASGAVFFVPFVADILLGLSHSCFNTAIWASPGLLVESRLMATAYGIASSGCQLGMTVNDLVSGSLIDHYGYFVQELFFICFLSLGMLVLFVLFVRVAGTNSLVNMSGFKRRRLARERRAASPTIDDRLCTSERILDYETFHRFKDKPNHS